MTKTEKYRVTIRQACVADGPAITELLAQLDYHGCGDFIGQKIEQQLAHADAQLLVATVDAEVLGLISLHFIPQLAVRGDFCRISYLCVAERSRHQGVGALLEAAALRLAREKRCDRIELHCDQRRARAHRFYARQGYGESPKYLRKSLGDDA